MRLFERLSARLIVCAVAPCLSGCETLALMLAPDPSDFVAALMGGAAAARGKSAPPLNRWPPMTASEELAEAAVARPATARCAGLRDTALLDCVIALARVDEASRPLFDSCAMRVDGPRELEACAELSWGVETDPTRMATCASVTDFEWHACAARVARPKGSLPLQGRVLHALESFRRAEEGKRSPAPPRGSLLVANAPDAASEAPSSALTPQRFTALCDGAFEQEEDRNTCHDLAQVEPNESASVAASAPRAEQGDHATLRPLFQPTAEAFATCTRKEGGRFLAREALTCLRHSSARRADPTEYATCESAFRPGHPGFLSYVRACAARVGFRLYAQEDASELGAALDTAVAKAGASRTRLLESYEALSADVRRGVPPGHGAF